MKISARITSGSTSGSLRIAASPLPTATTSIPRSFIARVTIFWMLLLSSATKIVATRCLRCTPAIGSTSPEVSQHVRKVLCPSGTAGGGGLPGDYLAKAFLLLAAGLFLVLVVVFLVLIRLLVLVVGRLGGIGGWFDVRWRGIGLGWGLRAWCRRRCASGGGADRRSRRHPLHVGRVSPRRSAARRAPHGRLGALDKGLGSGGGFGRRGEVGLTGLGGHGNVRSGVQDPQWSPEHPGSFAIHLAFVLHARQGVGFRLRHGHAELHQPGLGVVHKIGERVFAHDPAVELRCDVALLRAFKKIAQHPERPVGLAVERVAAGHFQ